MFIRSAYNYDRRENSDSTAFVSEEATLAQQSFKDECDINVLVKRFGLTGEVPVGWRMPYYGDFTEAMSYQDMCDAVISADAAFMELPAELRDRFANDPQRLFDFLSSDKNRDEAIRLGLVQPSAVVPPVVPVSSLSVGGLQSGASTPTVSP